MCKVSCIIPLYNQENLICKCLDSIPKRKDIEIIVVNDGSTDRSLKTVERYKEKMLPELKILTYEENKGVSYARNLGLENANGKYVVFVDSDDSVNPFYFLKVVDTYLDGADMIFYDMMINSGVKIECNKTNINSRVGMFKFIKKSFIGDTRFPIGVNYGEDRVFHEELLSKKPDIYFSKMTVYYYNYPRDNSLSDIGRKAKALTNKKSVL